MSPPLAGAASPSGPAESRTLRRAVRTTADGRTVEESEIRLPPGWRGAGGHRHRHGEERYEIVAGRVRVTVEGCARVYRPGESVIVAAGLAHALEPVDGEGARLVVQRCAPGGAPAG